MARAKEKAQNGAQVRADSAFELPVRVGVRKAYKMLIGGQFVRSESGRYIQVADPMELGGAKENVPWGSRKDVRDAVVVARGAWEGWSGRTAYNRGQILYRLAEMLEARHGEFCRVLERGGSDASAAAGEVSATIDRCVSYAGWADKYQSLFASLNPVAGPHFNFTVPESMGVVGVVAPARPALLGLLGAVLPIITAGNTVVVLASEADPRTALVLGEALATSDLPAGVINIVTGRASELLVHLAKHMDVSALDLHGVEASLVKKAEEAAIGNVKRVRTRSLDDGAWFDADGACSPRWIERFVEMKTIWHPSGS
jgi:acyl-CoA reductase-like NAD-dependent aldehyde dehydrogenase